MRFKDGDDEDGEMKPEDESYDTANKDPGLISKPEPTML